MESIPNNIHKIKDLLKYLPQQSYFKKIEDEDIIRNINYYYRSIDTIDITNKIVTLFIVKLAAEIEISDAQYENIKNILKNYDELSYSSNFLDSAINQLKDNIIFNSINEILS